VDTSKICLSVQQGTFVIFINKENLHFCNNCMVLKLRNRRKVSQRQARFKTTLFFIETELTTFWPHDNPPEVNLSGELVLKLIKGYVSKETVVMRRRSHGITR